MEEFTLGETAIDFDTNNLPSASRRPSIAANLRFPETLTPDSPLVKQLGTRRLNFARRLDTRLVEAFSLPPIGSTGDLRGKAGRVPKRARRRLRH